MQPPGRKESDKEMNRGAEWHKEGEGSRESPLSMFSEQAIYFHYACSDSFPISSSTQCIVADWAVSSRHLLMTHQQAWQHIIDMPIQTDVLLSKTHTDIERFKWWKVPTYPHYLFSETRCGFISLLCIQLLIFFLENTHQICTRSITVHLPAHKQTHIPW